MIRSAAGGAAARPAAESASAFVTSMTFVVSRLRTTSGYARPIVEMPVQLEPQTQEGEMNAVSSNPNASVTAFAGAITVLLVWGVGFAGVPIPGEVASAFTTVVAAVILFVGRIERARPTPDRRATTVINV
jgi:hypothetical protein